MAHAMRPLLHERLVWFAEVDGEPARLRPVPAQPERGDPRPVRPAAAVRLGQAAVAAEARPAEDRARAADGGQPAPRRHAPRPAAGAARGRGAAARGRRHGHPGGRDVLGAGGQRCRCATSPRRWAAAPTRPTGCTRSLSPRERPHLTRARTVATALRRRPVPVRPIARQRSSELTRMPGFTPTSSGLPPRNGATSPRWLEALDYAAHGESGLELLLGTGRAGARRCRIGGCARPRSSWPVA